MSTGAIKRPASLAPDRLQKLVERVPSTTGRTHTLVEVFTGEPLVELPQSSPEDVERAYAAARVAQAQWSQWSLAKRLKVFKRFHKALIDNLDTIADLIQAEGGKNRRMALEEGVDPAFVLRYYRANARRILSEKKHGGPVPVVSFAKATRQPKGVVGVIAPWNFPFALAVSDSIPALIAGNAVVLKPDNKTALSVLFAAKLLEESGLPRGVFQVVCGRGSSIGNTLIDNANYVMFTGSTESGRSIGERAARNLIGSCLELGGKNPALVLADANVDEAVQGLIFGAFGNSGQICLGIERIYVADEIYEEFKTKFVAAAAALKIAASYDFEPEVSALITPEHVADVQAHVDDAVAKGATVLTGGKARPDAGPSFFEPTVIEGLTDDMLPCRNETFGPVVGIYRFRTVDEAVALANDTDYGLNSSVWGTDLEAAEQVARRIHSGHVNINDALAIAFASKGAPSGGVKLSGLGSRHGDYGMLKYTDGQTIGVLKKQIMGPQPGQSYDAYVKQMKLSLNVMRRLVR